MLRPAAFLVAAAAFATALFHPAFRTPSGAPGGVFVVPLAAGVAALLFALAGRPGRLRSFAWLSLGMVGQAAALQLVRAGPGIAYQHHASPGGLVSAPILPWTVLVGVLLVAVVAGLRGRSDRLRQAFARGWPGWRGLAVVALFVLTSTTLTRDVPQYGFELLLAPLVQLGGLAAFVLAALDLPAADVLALRTRLDRWFGNDAGEGDDADAGFWRLDRWVVVAASGALVATALLCVLSYGRHPHVPDEVVYLIQAKYFAHGLLAMPAPPVPAAFDLDLMTYEATRWYSPVPPGWPAVLAIGVLAGVPWLVNPVLSAIGVVFAYVLLRDLYGRRSARIGVLLLCASPWFLFLGMSFMAHAFTLAVGLGGACCVAYLRRGASPVWTIPAGVSLGLLALIRPLEGGLVALLFALWLFRPASWRRSVARIAVMAVASMAVAATTLPYNRHFTGSATTFPIMAYTDALYGPGSNAIGFGSGRGLPFGGLDPFPGHGLPDIVVNTHFNLFQVNVELGGWICGSILLMSLLLFSRRMAGADRWMLIAILAITGGHAFYWFSGGPDFGARYWYLILVPCIGLLLGGLRVLGESMSDEADRVRPLLLVLMLTLSAVTSFVPWRAADKYHDYRGMQPGMRSLARQTGFGRSLVLVRGDRHPDYASAAVYNPVDLHADAPIYAWDRDAAARRAVLEAYRDRPVWIVDGPSRTGGAYRVVTGPVPAEQLLAEIDRGR